MAARMGAISTDLTAMATVNFERPYVLNELQIKKWEIVSKNLVKSLTETSLSKEI